MSLNKPRTSFGIHSMTPVNRDTGLPYGIVKVLGSANMSGERDTIDLNGGSNPNIWDSEDGNINNDITVTIREFHPSLLELAGWAKTENAAEASGAVTTLTNKNGTSTVNATTGIASVGLKAGETAELKDGVYVVKVASATTVDVYAISDLYFREGTDVTYQDDTGKITASALTISTGAEVEIPNTGVKLTGGSEAIGMTIGDTAIFEIRSTNEGSFEYEYNENPTPIEFGCYFFSQKKNNGEYQRLYVPRCKLSSFPSGMTEKEWQEAEVTIKVLYDNTAGYSKKGLDVVKDQA